MRLRLTLVAAAAGPRPLLLAASLMGWIGLIGSGQAFATSAYCTSAWHSELDAWRAFHSSLQFAAPGALAVHWFLMLLAMMPPLLAEPIAYVWRRSLARRRMRSLAGFLVAYLTIWMLAGIPLTLGAIALRGSADLDAGLAVLVIAVALLWQLTPAKQICLNRCHRLPRLAAFGWSADRDCVRYGTVTAVWCVGACWALMLAPLVIDGWHAAMMAAVSIVLIVERQMAPRPARWGLLRPAL